jgi:hypothetical protein
VSRVRNSNFIFLQLVSVRDSIARGAGSGTGRGRGRGASSGVVRGRDVTSGVGSGAGKGRGATSGR